MLELVILCFLSTSIGEKDMCYWLELPLLIKQLLMQAPLLYKSHFKQVKSKPSSFHFKTLSFPSKRSMFSLNSMPTTTSVLSTYTTFAASAMLVRTVFNELQTMSSQLIPQQLQDKILSALGGIFRNHSSQMTLVIDEYNGYSINQLYEASEIYLGTKVTPYVEKLKVSKAPREENICVTINRGEEIIDIFYGVQLKWETLCTELKQSFEGENLEKRSIELSFQKKYMEMVLSIYLPYVVERSKAIKEENKVVKLYSLGHFGGDSEGGPWGSIKLDHPSTFDTLAIDPVLKKEIIDDLDRFVGRREFYQRVGKAWKRGYLLYGPPGTGKSSLVAAMANYLKFNIYDLELTSLQSNSELRRLLVSTTNRSILVIEDIDCSIEFQDRQAGEHNKSNSQLTLSGLLNFIDGLWSSCGDERIIVFTTNHKERLDPALLRPGRMDMHIHMSYCTPCGFKILASNYHDIKSHHLFTDIEGLLIPEIQVTPAEIAEELMKSEDADIALGELIKFLHKKKMECSKSNDVGGEISKEGKGSQEIAYGEKIVGNKSKGRKGKGKEIIEEKKARKNRKAKRGKCM